MDSSADREYDLAILMPIEAEFSDAKTNQTVARVVRKAFGASLENESQKITAQDFKAAIDKLNVDLWAFIRS